MKLLLLSLVSLAFGESTPVQRVLTFEDSVTPEQARQLALLAGAQVQALAALRGSPSGPLVQVLVPPERLSGLEALPGLLSISPVVLAQPKEVQTEGLDELFVDSDWQAQGLDGRGVRVGVLDVGFYGAEDLMGEELPLDLEIIGGEGSSQHGAAVAEIIADIAPAAEQRLYQVSSAVEFIAAIEQARGDRVDLISASLGFDNVWSADGSSPMSQAVDEAWDHGVVVVLAAGNERGRYFSGPLSDEDGDGYLEIEGVESVGVLAYGLEAEARLRWDEPFGQSGVDLALVLYDEDGLECDRSDEAQTGDDTPLESAACDEDRVSARIVGGAQALGLWAWIYAPGGVDGVTPTDRCTLTLPGDARGALSVGAYRLGTDTLETYSSYGPTEDGRLKPELVASSGVSTSSLGAQGFYGSSAATPHVAGLAALALDADRRLDPESLRDLLMSSARDLGAPGWDVASGAGATRAEDPPEGCGCSGVRIRESWALALLAAAIGMRRTPQREKLAKPPAMV